MVNFSNLGGNDKLYFKRNYVDVLEQLTPKFYLEEDRAASGIKYTPIDQLLNTHLVLAENFNLIFNVSSTPSTSSLRFLSGISQYFVKQNNLTNISPFEFETKILRPVGYSLNSFATSAELSSFLEDTLLPGIRLNTPSLVYTSSVERTHSYLIQTLSWLYFLNSNSFSGLVFSPSSFVKDIIIDKIYNGKTIYLNDCLKGVTKHLYENVGVCSLFSEFIPIDYVDSLDNLDTFIDILYSPLESDSKDFRVQEAFDDYISTEIIPEATQSNGPFRRLLDAISFSIYDVNSEIDNLGILYDIDRCPEAYLPYIAQLIGWKLFGHNVDKWRAQLKNAVKIYKAKGTKKAVQLAVDTVFGTDTFDLSGKINELYESYIPNMMYYALATDSSAFTDFTTWTQSTSYSMGVLDYSNTDMDTNIRFVVDSILLQAVHRFPDLFFVGNKRFNIHDPKFVFYYRERVYNIPPWESEKYYRFCRVSPELVQFIYNRLLCFGVSIQLADNVKSFILENTIENNSDIQVDNYWLIFTTDIFYPANYTSLISNYQSTKLKFLPLWSGKSSHFSLSLSADDFKFDKFSYLPKTSQGLNTMLGTLKEYTPAHSIPLVNIIAGNTDLIGYNETTCKYINFNSEEIKAGSGINVGFAQTAINMSSLSGVFSRSQVNSLYTNSFFSSTSTVSVKRNNIRRRDLANLIDKSGWYYRNGFNGPSPFTPSATEHSLTASNIGFLPLGYIPSSCTFVPIEDYDNIPSIYSWCENLNSSSVYSGVPVSSTFPCRGPDTILTSSCYLFNNRGMLTPIVGVMHTQLEKAFLALGEELKNNSYILSSLGIQEDTYNVARSIGNYFVSSFPLTQDFFNNFEFGRGLQKVYYDYTNYFKAHSLGAAIADCSGGKDLFSHAYGPLLYNSQFNIPGSAILAHPEYIASSFNSIFKLNYNNGSGVLSQAGSSVGTFVASNISDCYVGKYEFRNPQILNGIEFVQTSGDSNDNEFIVYNVDPIYEKIGGENFTVDNPLIRAKSNSQNGLSRLRFNIKNYSPSNILMPEHEFNLTLKAFIGREGGTLIGGGTIGIWLHTNPENGYIWTWTPNNKWTIVPVTDLTPIKVKTELAFQYPFPLVEIGTDETLSSIDGPCIAEINNNGATNLIGMGNLQASFFKDLTIDFDTLNPPICLPNVYYDPLRKQVHAASQGYTIEIFLYPDNQGEVYAVYDSLSMIDKTENSRVTNYTPEQLLEVIKFFRDSKNGVASRVASVSLSNYETSGGSRDSYRRNPINDAGSVNSFTQMIDITLGITP